MCLSFFFFSSYTFAAEPSEYDVIVYGTTPAGISAAIQSARLGKKTALISKNGHVGGMTASGLTATDMNNHNLVGGIGEEFYRNIYHYYKSSENWKYEKRSDYFKKIASRVYTGINEERKIQWVFESKVAEEILINMLNKENIDLYFNFEVDSQNDVHIKNNKIQAIDLNNVKIKGKVFIDASYTGDLMAFSGVSYTVGRESQEKYDESLAGVIITEDKPTKIIEGKTSDILNSVKYQELEFGKKDLKTQAYCYRITLTDVKENQIPIFKPLNYDRSLYLYTLSKIKEHTNFPINKIMTFTPMPNRKTDTNGIDFVGANYAYPDGTPEDRKIIEANHKNFTLGLLYFLSSDASVPDQIKLEMSKWGLAKDEFTKTENFPHQIYVREARRMVSDYVMTQHNVQNGRIAPNPIAYASYSLDSHIVSRVYDDNGYIYNEGNFYKPADIYGISYLSITPSSNEVANLIVPVTLSASHVAFGSIRMEPTYFVIGQVAGTAASLAIDLNSSVQEIPYSTLSKFLVDENLILINKNNKNYHGWLFFMALLVPIYILVYLSIKKNKNPNNY